MAEVVLTSCYRGSRHGRLPVSCTYFEGELLVAIGGYADERVTHVFNQSQGMKFFDTPGHSGPVTCVGFDHCSSRHEARYLCTASEDRLLLWDLESTVVTFKKGNPCRGRLLASGQGYVSILSFCSHSQFVAFGHWNEVLVYRIKTAELDTTLSGHDGNITGVQFYPSNSHRVVTIAEDRTFKIWDLKNSVLLYQSAVLSAWPLTCLVISATDDDMIVGDSSGMLRIFSLSASGRCECICERDTTKLVTKWLSHQAKPVSSPISPTRAVADGPVFVSSRAKWKDSIPILPDTSSNEMGTGTSLLSMYLWTYTDTSNRDQSNPDLPPSGPPGPTHPLQCLLRECECLVVATHHSLMMLNRRTLELTHYRDLRDPVLHSTLTGDTQAATIPLMCAGQFVSSPLSPRPHGSSPPGNHGETSPPHGNEDCGTLYCVTSALMEPSVSVLEITIGKMTQGTAVGRGSKQNVEQWKDFTLSVLSKEPLSENSPLLAEMSSASAKLKSHSYHSVSTVKSKNLASGVVNQPLTFHSKIRSSGYSAAPSSKQLFVPNTSSSLRKVSSASQPKKYSGLFREKSIQEYPRNALPATHLKHSFTVTHRPSGINSLQHSSDGRRLVCACSDHSVHVLSSVLTTERGKAYTNHSGAVGRASWSHSDQMFVSCSTDKTACVWLPGQKEPLLTFSREKKNTKMQGKESSTSKGKGKDNLPFSQEVTSAQFFYLDKFILLSCGKQFFLYKYHIDMEKPDDVKRYQSSTQSVLVTALQSTSAQSITSLSAVNDFYSYIVLVCGSDKSIEIFDMNAGKSAAVLSNATERPVHCLAQNKGSKFISHPPEGYDLFLTSAVTDGVKLWDLRQSKCVQHFVTHPNRVQPVGVTFSPCAKYIATGAENRSAYIYDIRSQSPLHRLACHSDAVTSVSYHPLQNQMIAGTSDGKLCQFTTDA